MGVIRNNMVRTIPVRSSTGSVMTSALVRPQAIVMTEDAMYISEPHQDTVRLLVKAGGTSLGQHTKTLGSFFWVFLAAFSATAVIILTNRRNRQLIDRACLRQRRIAS